jgi:hypothetical protein
MGGFVDGKQVESVLPGEKGAEFAAKRGQFFRFDPDQEDRILQSLTILK